MKRRSSPSIPAFDPQIADPRIVVRPNVTVISSLGFWFSELRRRPCEECGIIGTLEVAQEPWGIVVYCGRPDCDYAQEIVFAIEGRQ